MRAQKGFTLVEILIVVVILGILAAIVIPQFTNASSEAKESAVAADLQTLRSQIELYKIQHGDALPTDDGHLGLGDGDNALTSRTNSAGEAWEDGDDGPFGPYMQKVPSNPFVSSGGNLISEGDTTGDAPADPDEGWIFNATTGEIKAADSDHWDL